MSEKTYYGRDARRYIQDAVAGFAAHGPMRLGITPDSVKTVREQAAYIEGLLVQGYPGPMHMVFRDDPNRHGKSEIVALCGNGSQSEENAKFLTGAPDMIICLLTQLAEAEELLDQAHQILDGEEHADWQVLYARWSEGPDFNQEAQI